MDAVNLTALFRTQEELDGEHSSYTSSPLEGTRKHDVDASALEATYNSSSDPNSNEKRTAAGAAHNNDDDDGGDGRHRNGLYTEEDFIALLGEEAAGKRRALNGHNDPTSDTLSLRTYWIALFTPNVYMSIFYALRITLLVALPLGILARHPKVMHIFPAGVVIPLWGIVDCRYAFGEQMAFSVLTVQNAIWTIIWGTINNSWNLLAHPAGWWCSVIFSAFALSLLGDVRARRLLVLNSVLILQMENLPGGTTLAFPAKVGRDMLLSTAFAIFQCLWPIKTVSKECDDMLASGWKHIGRIARNCVTACWSEDPIECAIALGHIGTEPVQTLLTTLPGRLFFVMYEFWESTLRLELRRERLSFIELCMPRLHTMTDSARAMVMKRVQRAQPQRRAASARHPAKAPAGPSPHTTTSDSDKHGPFADSEEHHMRSGLGAGVDVRSREPYGDLRDGGSNGGAADLHQRRRHEAEKDEFLREMERQESKQRSAGDGAAAKTRESSSVLVMQYKTPLWKRTSEILKPAVDHLLDALDAVLDGLGKHLNPRETAEKVPFAELREAATDLQSKLDEVHFEALIKSETPVDPFLYSNVFVFHLSLVVLSERLIEYGESMQNFDRSRYKSQLQRAWEFFFYDYWKSFWEELPKRITLATPRDVRIFKDAIKMACAYALGAMYTGHMDPEHTYYFGMAILMGCGLPTAGDTMEASVYRITGMVCACSIAYVATWHTPNLAGELAIAVAGVFIALLFRDRPPYAHTAGYCSMLCLTALNAASSKFVLICRVVSNSFTVMTYYAIVVFIFPIDVLRVTYNAQVKAIMLVADQFSRLVDVISQPFSPDDPAQFAAMQAEVLSIRAARVPMWGALHNVGAWLPKAAADPAPLGNPYPLQAMRDMYSSLRRLGSATDVICASMRVLLRDGAPQHRPDVEHILDAVAPVMQMMDRTVRVLFQDFLDALARPYEWSPSLTTYHFSIFLSLSRALHHACWTAHRRNVKALRANFRNKVMNRTFAAAAMSNIIDPTTLERARNLSFVLPTSDTYLPMPVARRDDPLRDQADPLTRDSTSSSSTPTHATTAPTSSSNRGESFEAVNVATPHSAQVQVDPASFSSPLTTTRMQRRPSTLRNASMATGHGTSHHEDAPPPPVTNGSIARTIAESVAIVRSTERRNSRLVRRDVSDRSGSFASAHVTPVPTPAAPRMANGSMVLVPGGNFLPSSMGNNPSTFVDDEEEAAEQSQCAKEQAEFEKALDPYERQAHEEERRAFIARRSLEHEHVTEENTLSLDVNMVLTILVGTDMFFAEAERLLKTMYAINEYARSRQPAPKPKDAAATK